MSPGSRGSHATDGGAPALQRPEARTAAGLCRKSYVHPAVFETYVEGALAGDLARRGPRPRGLRPEEAAVLQLLRGRLAAPLRPAKVA